ncbi:type VI-B CRISPR accessory protein Csx28 [Prevotella pallens]|uniref:type VI-B CRISPR accessory protein Csx28 n=1 Tax=Prevotella pallens TaxID=60133 RepID=UPI0023F12426|nr:CRISPR-associated protein Csx28 [Prevotella pallens]
MNCTLITQEVIIALITSLISSATIIFAGYQTYLNAIKKLHKESIENIERAKYEAILKAHQSIYKLLRFTTDTENDDCILLWEQSKGSKEKVYYFKQANICKFIKELTEEIYNKGNGIYLSKEVILLVFKYRTLVHKLLLAEKNNPDEKIMISKREIAKSMIEIHQSLSIQIRKDINLKQRDLCLNSENT